MIDNVYSECHHCLGNQEVLIKQKHKVKSILELLVIDEVPREVKMKIMHHVKPNGPGSSQKWFSGKNINDNLKRFAKEPQGEVKKPSIAVGGEKKKTCDGLTFFECGNQPSESEKRIPLYLGYSMIDFKTSGCPLGHLFTNNYFDKDENSEYLFNCLGTVLNTDDSYGGGQHWFAIFVNFVTEPYSLEYFDSGGTNIPPEIVELFKVLKGNQPDTIIINVSRRVQQKDRYSCGAYALYYVYARLQGVPWTYFRDNITGDNLMHKFREHLFSKIDD